MSLLQTSPGKQADTFLRSLVRGLGSTWPLFLVWGLLLGMLWPALDSVFAIIDDHEIVTLLGRQGRIDLAEAVSLIQRQIRGEGQGRFRPAYLVLRILQAHVVGSDPAWWHLNRLLLGLLSATLLYVALRAAVAPLPAAVFTLLFFAGPQNEIWIRLGPSEAYGVPLSLAGIAWISTAWVRGRRRPLLMAPGFVLLWLSGFTKESFIPLLPAALVFLYLVVPLLVPEERTLWRRFTVADFLVLGLAMAGFFGQVALVLQVLRDFGHVYLKTFSWLASAATLGTMLLWFSKDTAWWVVILAALFCRWRYAQQGAGQDWRETLRMGLFLLAGVGLLLVPQAAIYGVDLAGRYLIPGNLFVVFAVVVGYRELSTLTAPPVPWVRRGVLAILGGMVCWSAIETYENAEGHALSTQEFQASLTEVVKLKEEHPSAPLVFCSESPEDFEALYSVVFYLRVRLPDEQRPVLRFSVPEASADSPLDEHLVQQLCAISAQGNYLFRGLAELPPNTNDCIAVLFTVRDEAIPCAHSVRIRGR
jgi:hypothetical protein